jgi:ornithine carbamoyltransferase
MEGKQSAVWLEALNRIHVQKSIIEWCLNILNEEKINNLK